APRVPARELVARALRRLPRRGRHTSARRDDRPVVQKERRARRLAADKISRADNRRLALRALPLLREAARFAHVLCYLPRRRPVRLLLLGLASAAARLARLRVGVPRLRRRLPRRPRRAQLFARLALHRPPRRAVGHQREEPRAPRRASARLALLG